MLRSKWPIPDLDISRLLTFIVVEADVANVADRDTNFFDSRLPTADLN